MSPVSTHKMFGTFSEGRNRYFPLHFSDFVKLIVELIRRSSSCFCPGSLTLVFRSKSCLRKKFGNLRKKVRKTNNKCPTISTKEAKSRKLGWIHRIILYSGGKSYPFVSASANQLISIDWSSIYVP